MKQLVNFYNIINDSDSVICDFCGEDWSDSEKAGGFIFESKAVCPNCDAGMRKLTEEYKENHLIRAECPLNESFAQFVRQHRNHR